ncbi:MAG: OmpA family protein [Desulfobacterales bacterium]
MGKKKKAAEDEPVNVGAAMTVSLFLILLTFFILLNSIAVFDDEKIRIALGSLTGSFGSFPGGLSALNTGGSIMPESSPLTGQKVDLERLLSALDEKNQGRIELKKEADQDIITIDEKALFHENRHLLKIESSPLLDRLCAFIRQEDYLVEIVGHTGTRPGEEKGYRSNWELSSLMAVQVAEYFIKKGLIAPERLAAYGRGSQSPIASSHTRQSRAQNRRIEIILKFKVPPYQMRMFREKPAGIFTYKRFNFKVF